MSASRTVNELPEIGKITPPGMEGEISLDLHVPAEFGDGLLQKLHPTPQEKNIEGTDFKSVPRIFPAVP